MGCSYNKNKIKFGECRKQGLNFIVGLGPKLEQNCKTISETQGVLPFSMAGSL